MAIKVNKPGLATTVQDQGRQGNYHLGIPPSGAMDQISFRAANLLVGNDETRAALECALMGPELTFTEDTQIAVTGARMQPSIDGEEQLLDTVLDVAAGQTLSLKFASAGARSYIAVSGGIDVPEMLGSRSTYALGALGGLHGRTLKAEDVLETGTSPLLVRSASPASTFSGPAPQGAGDPDGARALQRARDPRIMDVFLSETWQVSSESDRIGYRFKGGTRSSSCPASHPSVRATTRRTSSTPATRSGRSKCPRPAADRAAPRRGVRRRLHDDRHRDQCRHGRLRPDAAQHQDPLRRRQPRGSAGGQSRASKPARGATRGDASLRPHVAGPPQREPSSLRAAAVATQSTVSGSDRPTGRAQLIHRTPRVCGDSVVRPRPAEVELKGAVIGTTGVRRPLVAPRNEHAAI